MQIIKFIIYFKTGLKEAGMVIILGGWEAHGLVSYYNII